ncbi:MAG: alanine racemase [Candidatus Puniceispirillum sp.]|nr:alanine racemase [Candidatus Pelagibacter sp.]MBA4282968.1 alanine racemase [Candidatus Puniceispirillum sp.]
MSRTAVALLSKDNLIHNIKKLRQKVPDSKIVGMVKANGYGHGLRSVSQSIQPYVDVLGVASIDEALALRAIQIKKPILLCEGVFEASEYVSSSTHHFYVVIHNRKQIEWLSRMNLPLPLNVWLKIDTGLGRLGFDVCELPSVFNQLSTMPQVAPNLCIMSHFACSDDKSHPLNQTQLDLFKHIKNAHLDHNLQYSLLNSGGILNFSQYQEDYVRPGLSMYGISPIKGTQAEDFNLKPVMTLQTSLIAIKSKYKGDTIGYGARYTCLEDMPVGIIAFGYGDGYPITAKDGTPVLIHNTLCPIIGRVAMDMMAVDLRPLYSQEPLYHPEIGDHVILWGEGLPLETVASYTSNIPYDILTGVQNRVRFIWYGKDQF